MSDTENPVVGPEIPPWYPSAEGFELIDATVCRMLWRGPHKIEKEAIFQTGKPIAIITRQPPKEEPEEGEEKWKIEAAGWLTWGRITFNRDGTVEVRENPNAYLSEKAATITEKRGTKGKTPLYDLVCRIRESFITPNPIQGIKSKVSGLPNDPTDSLAEVSIDACKHELYAVLNMIVKGDDSGLMDLAEAVKIHRQSFRTPDPVTLSKTIDADLKRIREEAERLIRIAKRKTELSASQLEAEIAAIMGNRDLRIELVKWQAPREIANRRKTAPGKWGYVIKAVELVAAAKWKRFDPKNPGKWGPIPSREEIAECFTGVNVREGLKGNKEANINLEELRTYLGQLGFGWLPTKRPKG